MPRSTWRHVGRFLGVALPVLAAVLPVGASSRGDAPALVKGPWTAVTADTAVISFEVSRPVSGLIEYGPADMGLTASLPFKVGGGIHHIPLADLLPGATYVYSIEIGSGERSPPGYFHTPPEGFTPFLFLVYGDTRTFYARHHMVARRMAAEEASFVVHTGDLVTSPISREWNEFFASARELLLAMSFFPVIGNHERNHFSYYRLFELPGAGGKAGEQWWTFRWGEVLFVGLDSNTQFLGVTGLQEETEWLEGILSQEARFKFVFFHHPLFSSDPHYGGNEGLAKLWHPIFRDKGVTAIFCGHVHAYEHIVRDGVHYFTTGGGGAPAYPLGEPVEGTLFAAESILHYLRVSVEENAVQVEMIPVAKVPLGEEEGEIIPLGGEPLEVFRIEAGIPAAVP